jgi:hypothetical protein
MANNNKPTSDSVSGIFKATFGTVAFQTEYISITQQYNGRISIHGDGEIGGKKAAVSFSFMQQGAVGNFDLTKRLRIRMFGLLARGRMTTLEQPKDAVQLLTTEREDQRRFCW